MHENKDVPESSKGMGNTKTIPPAKHWVFTLNNYTIEDIVLFQESKLIEKYIFQEETGEQGTPHLQGYLKFYTKKRPKNLFNHKIHWEKCKHIKESINYCQKQDTRTGSIYNKNIKITKPIKIITKLYEWQQNLETILKQEPDDRTIRWYWDDIGNKGKTSFCKYLVVKHQALYVSGKIGDMAYALMKYRESNGDPEIILIDIPRASYNRISYPGIEALKNGLIFSSKYESGQIVMNSPHVVVFANSEPSYELLSVDRWKVVRLT